MEKNEAYSKALRRINACIARKTTKLDLSSLGLGEIPLEIGKCLWITHLDLEYNFIDRIRGIDNLVNLIEINLNVSPPPTPSFFI